MWWDACIACQANAFALRFAISQPCFCMMNYWTQSLKLWVCCFVLRCLARNLKCQLVLRWWQHLITPIWAASQSKKCWFVPSHLFHSFPSSKHCRESFRVTFALFSLFFSFWISLYITQIYSNILPVSPMRVFAPPVGAHCFASWSCFIWAKESTGDLVGRRRGIL